MALSFLLKLLNMMVVLIDCYQPMLDLNMMNELNMAFHSRLIIFIIAMTLIQLVLIFYLFVASKRFNSL